MTGAKPSTQFLLAKAGAAQSRGQRQETKGDLRSRRELGAGTGRQQQACSPPASYHSCCGRRDLLIRHQPAPTSQNRSGTTHTRQTGTQQPSSFGGSCHLLPVVANRLVRWANVGEPCSTEMKVSPLRGLQTLLTEIQDHTIKDWDKPPVADSCANPFQDEVIDMGTLRIH